MVDASAKSVNPVIEFTDQEIESYKINRYNLFRSTIAICIIYASIALIIILIGYFTAWGREFLLNTLFPFIITYIIGTIIIIIMLAEMINTYVPTKIITNKYNDLSCPDYWILSKTQNTYYNDDDPSNVSTPGFDEKNITPLSFKYNCQLDQTIFDKDTIKSKDNINIFYNSDSNHIYKDLIINNKIDNINLTNNNDKNNFIDYSIIMAGKKLPLPLALKASGNGHTFSELSDAAINTDMRYKTGTTTFTSATEAPLMCDKVYPAYLAQKDSENMKLNKSDKPNKFRCAYAKACGISWSDVGCFE